MCRRNFSCVDGRGTGSGTSSDTIAAFASVPQVPSVAGQAPRSGKRWPSPCSQPHFPILVIFYRIVETQVAQAPKCPVFTGNLDVPPRWLSGGTNNYSRNYSSDGISCANESHRMWDFRASGQFKSIELSTTLNRFRAPQTKIISTFYYALNQ